MKTIEEVKKFYTILSKEDNRYSEYPKIFRCHTKNNIFLPSQPYVYPIDTRPTWNQKKDVKVSYSGTLTGEQEFVSSIVRKRHEEYNYSCGLIHLGTGKGKSHIIMDITSYFKTKTLVLCHNQKTLREMATKFKEYCGYDVGQFYSLKKDIRDITITTHVSFVEQGGFPGEFDIILYDEADHGLSKQMIQALCESNAKGLYGFTGTPFRKEFDKADMEKIFGKMIESKDDAKYNMIPKITQYQYTSPIRKEYEYLNWAECRGCLMNDKDRNLTQFNIVSELMKDRQTGLILTDRVEEAKMFLEMFSGYEGIDKVALITGETKHKDDEKFVSENVGKCKTLIIGTVGKMARGVDIPAIDTVFLFSPLHFEGTVVQAVGRGLRNFPGKKDMVLIDFSDRPLLYQQSYARMKAYQREYGITKDSITQIKLGSTTQISLDL